MPVFGLLKSEEMLSYKQMVKIKIEKIDKWAKIIWDYLRLNQTLKETDCLMVLCSHETRVAEYAAELFLRGWAPYFICSGNLGSLTGKTFKKPEAEVFAEIAIKAGVPREQVFVENKSTNTGDNFRFTQRMIREKGLSFNSFILVQKPYMERRVYATVRKVWPDKEIIVTSPAIAYNEYPTEVYPKDKVLNALAGEIQRIKEYPEKGFQISQEIPAEVWQAYEKLVELGYDKHLAKK